MTRGGIFSLPVHFDNPRSIDLASVRSSTLAQRPLRKRNVGPTNICDDKFSATQLVLVLSSMQGEGKFGSQRLGVVAEVAIALMLLSCRWGWR